MNESSVKPKKNKASSSKKKLLIIDDENIIENLPLETPNLITLENQEKEDDKPEPVFEPEPEPEPVIEPEPEPVIEPEPEPVFEPEPEPVFEPENIEEEKEIAEPPLNKEEEIVDFQELKGKKRNNKSFSTFENVYEKSLLTRDITINIIYIGKYIKETIENIIKNEIEGKCGIEGYIKKNSVSLINYSSGLIKGENITFTTTFTCDICFPVEGMLINCKAVSDPTKAGIRAEHETEKPSPFVAFISRDHHYNNSYFNSIKQGDVFKARIIGQTFELNDSIISIIAELVKPQKDYKKQNKPRIEFN